MTFLWRRNWNEPAVPVEVISWMPLSGYTFDEVGELRSVTVPAKVVAVAVVDNKVCSIDIDELEVEREH